MVLSNKKLRQKLREAKADLLLASESEKNSSIKNPIFSEDPSIKYQESVQSLLKTAAQFPRLSKREKRREKIESLGEKSESLGEKSESLVEKNEYLCEKFESLRKSDFLGKKFESLGENVGYLTENIEFLGGKLGFLRENEVEKGEGEGRVEGMDVDEEKKREKRKKRKIGDVDNGEGEGVVEDIYVYEGKKRVKREKREKRELRNKRKRGEVDNGEVKEVKEVKRDSISKKKKKKKKKLKKKKKVENGDLVKMGVVKDGGGNGEQVVVESNQTMVGNNYESKENLDPCKKVYVGGIPFYSTEDDIRSYFEGCGTITEIDCMKFPESGKFRGIAIITFKTEAASERALALDGSDMGGLFLKIQPYKSERANRASPFAPAIVEGYNRIYVGNLAWDITEDDVKNLFSSCNITSIRFGLDKETGEFKGYGHVDFADSESVKTALRLDQNVVCGRPIKISCAVAQKGAVTAPTPVQQKTVSNQLKNEDKKPLEQNTNTNDSHISEVAVEPVSAKIRRRTCYECGEKGHLSSACPKQQATDQENPIRISYDVAKKAVTGSTPLQQKTIFDQLRSEDSKLLEQYTNPNYPNGNDTSEVALAPASSKIKRRTCYECGEKGHLSSACPKKQVTDQENPSRISCDVVKKEAVTGSTPLQQMTIYNQLRSEDSKPLEGYTEPNYPNGNDTSEVAVVPVSSKIKRRTCYECGEKGHLSSACPKKLAAVQENPGTS